MRELSSAMTAHLATGATTLCTCWRFRRKDNVVLCFTDHDRDIVFDNCIFAAASGLEGGNSESHLGFAVGGVEVTGVLNAGSLVERDLADGAFDGADVEIWRVNWADSAQRVLMDVATIGEVRRSAESFTAELRSLAHLLDHENGRRFQTSCSADLGDARCGMVIDIPAYSTTTSVSGGDGRLEILTDGLAFELAFFTGGRLTVMNGAMTGVTRAIEQHEQRGNATSIRLWSRLPEIPAIGTVLKLVAGCDKTFATCRMKFANQTRFRGFPHIPGNDALLAHVSGTAARLDGGSLFR